LAPLSESPAGLRNEEFDRWFNLLESSAPYLLTAVIVLVIAGLLACVLCRYITVRGRQRLIRCVHSRQQAGLPSSSAAAQTAAAGAAGTGPKGIINQNLREDVEYGS
jgi:hypothetical protein